MKMSKSIFLSLISTTFIFTSVSATTYMYVKTTDGEVVKYETDDVSEVDFEEVAIPADSGKISNYAYVDLGLPSGLKWAACNVGANAPQEYGNYFAWGETSEKEDHIYTYATYKWCEGKDRTYTKYCSDDRYGKVVDYKKVLDLEDDAAAVNMGNGWRMPTSTEMKELFLSCVWSWTKNYNKTGVAGAIGRSIYNDNVIFFPAAGSYSDGGFGYKGSHGFYISSNNYLTETATGFHMYDADVNMSDFNSRSNGYSIRAVVGDLYDVNFFNSDSSLIKSIKVEKGRAAVTPDAPVLVGYEFVGWNDSSFTKVSQNLNIYAVYKEKTSDVGDDGVTVSGKAAGYDYVDLALKSGLKWATCNLGATKPTEGGNYIAWGEVSEKEDYSWSTYKFGSMSEITKYVDDEYADNYDKRTVLEADDDAASFNWGLTWRMPTKADVEELIAGCDWKWVENFNGCGQYHYGMVGTSKVNGNIIYLPAVGNRYGDDFGNTSIEAGFYWTSNLLPNTMFSDNAYYLVFGDYIYPPTDDYSPKLISGGRDYGYSIRAVTK